MPALLRTITSPTTFSLHQNRDILVFYIHQSRMSWVMEYCHARYSKDILYDLVKVLLRVHKLCIDNFTRCAHEHCVVPPPFHKHGYLSMQHIRHFHGDFFKEGRYLG